LCTPDGSSCSGLLTGKASGGQRLSKQQQQQGRGDWGRKAQRRSAGGDRPQQHSIHHQCTHPFSSPSCLPAACPGVCVPVRCEQRRALDCAQRRRTDAI
jgi:hypothetical protein